MNQNQPTKLCSSPLIFPEDGERNIAFMSSSNSAEDTTPRLMDEEDVVMVDKKDAEDPSAAPAGGAGAAPDAAPAKPEVLIRNLCILPPRQSKKAKKARKDLDALGAIPLPVLRPEEPVQSIRTALSEVKGYAHLTSYRLVVEERPEGIEAALAARRKGVADGSPSSASSGGDEGGVSGAATAGGTASKKSKKKKSKGGGGGDSGSNTPNRGVAPADVVSPHTGPNAVVATPSSARSLEVATYTHYLGTTIPAEAAAEVAAAAASSPGNNGKKKGRKHADDEDADEIVLDDFTDLSPYLERGLTSDKAALRIVLERYNVAGVRDHVGRLQQLFDGLVPSVTTLAEGAEEGEQQPVEAEAEKEEPPASSSMAAGAEGDDEKKVEEEESNETDSGTKDAAVEKKENGAKVRNIEVWRWALIIACFCFPLQCVIVSHSHFQ